ncbi:MAG: uracil phosphoribosyltransferase [Herpetosiphon sp.]
MNVFVSRHPLVQHKQTLLRAVETEPKKFRQLVHEITQLLMYEATLDLQLTEHAVNTPLATYNGSKIKERVGLVPILRAGLGMVDAALDLVPTARVWHLGLYRDHTTLEPVAYYNKLPQQPDTDVCLILDPMLATGGSAIAAVDVLKAWGAPRIKFVGLVGAPEGTQRLQAAHPDVAIYLAALDERLNESAYILPGLGDAGDRQFGTG